MSQVALATLDFDSDEERSRQDSCEEAFSVIRRLGRKGSRSRSLLASKVRSSKRPGWSQLLRRCV